LEKLQLLARFNTFIFSTDVKMNFSRQQLIGHISVVIFLCMPDFFGISISFFFFLNNKIRFSFAGNELIPNNMNEFMT